jgi:hypothetical protein
MKLVLSPIRTEQTLTASVEKDALTLNGQRIDFADLPAGAVLPKEEIACDWIADDVSRDAEGLLTIPLMLPHGPNAPRETLFPKPLLVKRGKVRLPPYDVDVASDTL